MEGPRVAWSLVAHRGKKPEDPGDPQGEAE